MTNQTRMDQIRIEADALQFQIRFQLETAPNDLNTIVSVRRKAQELVALLEQQEYFAQEGDKSVAV